MRGLYFFGTIFLIAIAGAAFKQAGVKDPVYNGTDLGVIYSPSKTTFKVWAPAASGVKTSLI